MDFDGDPDWIAAAKVLIGLTVALLGLVSVTVLVGCSLHRARSEV